MSILNLFFSRKLVCMAAMMLVASVSAEAPRLDTPIIQPNRVVQLTVHGDAGAEYSVEWSVNLNDWSLVDGGAALNGVLTVQHDASAYSTIFYRAKGAGVDSALWIYPAQLSLNVAGEGVLLALRGTGPVTWLSSDPSIVTVDTNGAVKALVKGSAVISAMAGTETASAT